MNPFFKNLALWLVIGLIMVLVFNIFNQTQPMQKELIFSDFMTKVEHGEVSEVTLRGNDIIGRLTDNSVFRSYFPDDKDMLPMLRKAGVKITAKPSEGQPWYMTFLLSWLPMLLFLGIWVFFMRQMQGGGAKALSFGKSRARLLSDKQNKVTFADVAGVDEAKEELQEIIEFLKDPQKFQKLGGRIPKGVLLMGSPGTGKTLLAGQSLARPMCPSSPSPAPILWRCSWGLAPPGCEISSSKARKTPPASFSWTRSMPWGGIGERAWGVGTTSGNRR